MTGRYRLLAAALIVALLGLGGGASAADQPIDVARRVTLGLVDAAKTQRSRPHFLQAAVLALAPYLDAPQMAAIAAGRWWRQMTPEMRKQVADEYRKLIVGTFAQAIAHTANQPLRFMPGHSNPSDEYVEIHAEFTAPGGTSPIAYRLEREGSLWKIVDIKLGPTWLTQEYKGVFANALTRDGNATNLLRLLMARNRGLGME